MKGALCVKRKGTAEFDRMNTLNGLFIAVSRSELIHRFNILYVLETLRHSMGDVVLLLNESLVDDHFEIWL